MIQVIIPTYNRPKCIELLLRDCINVYRGTLFKFTILDSSPNDDTEKLAKKSSRARYKRFDHTIPADDKAIGEIMDCCEEYYWLLGDGNLVDFNSAEKLIGSIPKFDVLEIDSVFSKRNTMSLQEEYETHDALLDFIKTRYSHLTYWGASIVKTELTKSIFKSGKMNRYREDSTSWWSAALIAEMISDDMAKGETTKIFTLFTSCMRGNPQKKDQGWTFGENYYYLTFEIFDKDVYMLPTCFDEIKDEIIRIFRDDTMATKRKLIHLKRRGVIKLEYVLKYKKSIQDVNGYFGFIFVLACMPNFCIEVAYKIYKLLKGGQ